MGIAICLLVEPNELENDRLEEEICCCARGVHDSDT